MGEIPEDVRRTVERVVKRGYNEGLVDAVARALLAERERCARVAESFGAPDRYGQIHGETYLDADIIAAAIRKGD